MAVWKVVQYQRQAFLFPSSTFNPPAPVITATFQVVQQPVRRKEYRYSLPYFFYGFPSTTFPAAAPVLVYQIALMPIRRKELRYALPYLSWYPFTPVPTAYDSTPLALVGRSGSTIPKIGRSQSAVALHGESGSTIAKTGHI